MIKSAIAVACLAAPLTLAAPAHAYAHGLAVNFNPVIDGVQVTATDTSDVDFGPMNCTYDASPVSGLGTLVKPTHHEFTLQPKGQMQFDLPGVPTGTQWNVTINCPWTGKGPGLGLHWDGPVTY